MVRLTPWILVACLASPSTLPAQGGQPAPSGGAGQKAPRDEKVINKEIALLLVGFAKAAEGQKAHDEARRAYREIVAHYDSDNGHARAGLGWKKVKGEWQQATPEASLPKDACQGAQRKQVTTAWEAARKKVGALHRDLGQALMAAEERVRAMTQFERALAFVPDDEAAHSALGHEKFDGFYGTSEEIAFAKRMRAVFDKAREIQGMDIKAEPVDAGSMPETLKRTGIAFAGARSENVTYWVVGSQDAAAACAVANQRAVLLWQSLLGDNPGNKRSMVPRPSKWVVIVREEAQVRQLLEQSPECCGRLPMDQVLLFGGWAFEIAGGWAEWAIVTDSDLDHAVGQFTRRSPRAMNDALVEGMVHMATWLLCDSMLTSYGYLPKTASGYERKPVDPDDWLNRLRDEVAAGKDYPLVHVPRERMDNFRLTTRFKSWAFMIWFVARYPHKWVELLSRLHNPREAAIAEEEVAKAFQDVLGRSVAEVEAEWREWIRRGSPIGRASGLPQ